MVTNVTDFGAFVDIGTDHDGLVHLSELANRFVRDPRQVVRVGQVVRVKIIELDKEAPRISLSMKALQPSPKRAHRAKADHKPGEERSKTSGQERPRRNAGAKMPADAKRRSDRKSRPPKRAAKQTRRDGPSKPKIHQSGDRSQLNTQFADQLADLKEKLGS